MFCAAPHGAAAALIDSLLKAAEAAGTKPRFVDISADFRFATAAAYEAVYKHPHGAPHRLAQFTCAVPEHLKKVTTPHVGHPGCFSTAILLASVPLLSSGMDRAHAVRQRRHRQHRLGPQARRRHAPSDAPQRPVFLRRAWPSPHAGNHRAGEGGHRASMRSSPSCRTRVRLRAASMPPCRRASSRRAMRRPWSACCASSTRAAPFVRVLDNAPRVKDIVASNYAHLSAVANGRTSP